MTQSLPHAFKCAAEGVAFAFKQRNMRIDSGFAVAAVVLGFALRIDASSWLAIVICIGAVMAAETANTAIEDINPFDWVRYRDLVGDEDVDSVKKMGIILRIASALDRSLSTVVKGINCDILGDSVIMKTEVDGDAALEINSALEIGADFRKIFKKNLEIL